MYQTYSNVLTDREVPRDTNRDGVRVSLTKTICSLTESTGDTRDHILHTILHNLERGTTNYAYSQHYSDRH